MTFSGAPCSGPWRCMVIIILIVCALSPELSQFPKLHMSITAAEVGLSSGKKLAVTANVDKEAKVKPTAWMSWIRRRPGT